MKDYRCHEAKRLAKNSMSHMISVAGEGRGLDIPPTIEPPKGTNHLPLHVVLTAQMPINVRPMMAEALATCRNICKLQYDMFDFDGNGMYTILCKVPSVSLCAFIC